MTIHFKTSLVGNSDNIKYKTRKPCNENQSLKSIIFLIIVFVIVIVIIFSSFSMLLRLPIFIPILIIIVMTTFAIAIFIIISSFSMLLTYFSSFYHSLLSFYISNILNFKQMTWPKHCSKLALKVLRLYQCL